jgi:hypothetical protein
MRARNIHHSEHGTSARCRLDSRMTFGNQSSLEVSHTPPPAITHGLNFDVEVGAPERALEASTELMPGSQQGSHGERDTSAMAALNSLRACTCAAHHAS